MTSNQIFTLALVGMIVGGVTITVPLSIMAYKEPKCAALVMSGITDVGKTLLPRLATST